MCPAGVLPDLTPPSKQHSAYYLSGEAQHAMCAASVCWGAHRVGPAACVRGPKLLCRVVAEGGRHDGAC